MVDSERKIIQYRIEFPVTPTISDPRDFTCPSECAQYAIDNCGLQDKAICIEADIKPSVFSQKKDAVNTHFTDDEYARVAKAIIRLGRREYGELMFKWHAARLLPEPTKKEKLFGEMKTIDRRRAEIVAELERS
jgi:hypothetical protein